MCEEASVTFIVVIAVDSVSSPQDNHQLRNTIQLPRCRKSSCATMRIKSDSVATLYPLSE